MREAWMDDALCAEISQEMFFPGKGDNTHQAKAVCAACDVRMQCLEFAIRNDEQYGIWGGLVRGERKRLGLKAG